MKEQLRNELLNAITTELEVEDVRKIANIIDIVMYKYTVKLDSNEIIEYSNTNEKAVKQYVASLKIEGKSDKTIEQYLLAIRLLLDDINKNLDEITTSDIRYHLATYQQRRNVSKATIDNKRRCLSAFFSWLYAEEIIHKNPMCRIKKVKQDKIIRKPFTDTQVEKLKQNITNLTDKALIEFMLSTGCRVGELRNLNLEDISGNECYVFGKGSKERVVYMSEKCIFYLRMYLNSRTDTCSALFVNKRGERMSIQSIQKRMKELGKRAGIENVHPHRFRHTFATNALSRGMSVQNLQKIMGHTSIDTTMLYCSIDRNDIKYEHLKFAS